MNNIKQIELRVTRPDLYAADCQDFWLQNGTYYIGRDQDDCMEQARKEFGTQRLATRITRKWDRNGECVFMLGRWGKQII